MQAARLVQILTVAAALLLSAAASAQFGRGGGEFANIPARYMPRQLPDRNFVVCRLQYTSVRREPSGGGWRTDYPYGEINLTTRLSELTRTPVSRDTDGRPNHYVVRLIDNELFECPFTMASDVGTIGLHAMKSSSCGSTCSKAGSCGWTISGARPRGSNGGANWPVCCRRRNIPSRMLRSPIRFSAPSSR